jgi:hypothetical protein
MTAPFEVHIVPWPGAIRCHQNKYALIEFYDPLIPQLEAVIKHLCPQLDYLEYGFKDGTDFCIITNDALGSAVACHYNLFYRYRYMDIMITCGNVETEAHKVDKAVPLDKFKDYIFKKTGIRPREIFKCVQNDAELCSTLLTESLWAKLYKFSGYSGGKQWFTVLGDKAYQEKLLQTAQYQDISVIVV